MLDKVKTKIMFKIPLLFITLLYGCFPLGAEIQFVQFKWNAAICRDTCIPLLAKQLENMPQILDFQIDAHAGIANVRWRPDAEFSYGYFNFATRAAGVRMADIRVQVRGTIDHYGGDIFIVSLGDDTHFRVIGPLKTEPSRYTIKANLANHPLTPQREEKLIEASRSGEVITIEGPLFEPQNNILTIIAEKIFFPKEP